MTVGRAPKPAPVPTPAPSPQRTVKLVANPTTAARTATIQVTVTWTVGASCTLTRVGPSPTTNSHVYAAQKIGSTGTTVFTAVHAYNKTAGAYTLTAACKGPTGSASITYTFT